MGPHGDTRIKRIELSDGNWAEVRTVMTVGDVRFQRAEAQARGYSDDTLDSLALIDRLVVQWSYGDVSREKVDALPVQDALMIVSAINDAILDRPNPSSPSSDGTDEGVRKMRVARRASGPSA